MRATFSELSRSFRHLFVFSFICLFSYVAWQMAHTTKYTKASLSELDAAFSEIDHFPNGRLDGSVRKSSKITLQFVSADYKARAVFVDVEKFYADELQSLGWRFMERRETATGIYVKYCRSDLDAVFETVNELNSSDEVRYYFGVSRQSGPRVKSGC